MLWQAIFQDLQHMLENRTEALSKVGHASCDVGLGHACLHVLNGAAQSIEESCGLPPTATDSELLNFKDTILAKMDAVKWVHACMLHLG